MSLRFRSIYTDCLLRNNKIMDKNFDRITVDVPRTKFVVGQMIERKGKELPYHLFLHIISARAEGSFCYVNGKAYLSVENVFYTFVYQKGSRDAIGKLIRPGVVGTSDQSLESESEVVLCDKMIVAPDTDDNIFVRKKEWKIIE